MAVSREIRVLQKSVDGRYIISLNLGGTPAVYRDTYEGINKTAAFWKPCKVVWLCDE